MHVTLRQLKVFETVARLGSFTRAAEELCLSQPTVSMQVKQLSEAVDQSLFEQVGKKIFLTDMGRELYATAREIFETWSRFEMTVADMKGLKKGRLRLACVTTAKYFVPRLLGPFSDRYPGIDIRLEVASRDEIVERLGRSDDELTIMSMPPQALNVAQHAFLDNALVPIGPTHHPLAKRSRIPLGEFAAERLLLRERGSETRLATERFFREHGMTLHARMEIGSNEAIKQAVAGGLGVTVISQHALLWEPMPTQIAVLDVEGFPIPGAWSVVYPGDRRLSVVAQAFFDYLGSDARLFDPMNTPAPRA
ncbi:MAG: LysR substrate-binding domain-containing protein [Burkholderiales bacterium]